MTDDYYAGPYDPATWWGAHAAEKAKWEDEQPDAPEIRRLRAMVRPRSVVELGCGPGRNTAFFKGIGYTGIDVSSTYLERAIAKYPSTMAWSPKFVQGDLTYTLPERDKAGDLVFADSTLQHVQPEFIRWAMMEAFRVSSRWVCAIEYTEEQPWETAEVSPSPQPSPPGVGARGFFEQVHVFQHDYAALAEPWGELVWRTDIAAKVQPARKELFLWRKR